MVTRCVGKKAHGFIGQRALSYARQIRYSVNMKKLIVLLLFCAAVPQLVLAQGNKLRPVLRTMAEKQAAQNSYQSAQRLLKEIPNSFPSLRHVNRQRAKQPVTKFCPSSEDIELWTKLKTGYLTTRSNNKALLINKIIRRHTNMSSALIDLRKLEKIYGKQDFFLLFVTAYYNRELGEMAPSLYDALQTIYLQNNPVQQNRAVARMQFLFQNKNRIFSALQQELPPKGSWRLQWLPELAAARSIYTDINRIVLSYERALKPFRRDVSLDHINSASTVHIQGEDVPVVYFPGDLQDLPLLYQQLLYKEPGTLPLFVLADKAKRSMIIFNTEKNKWIRISKHEFADPHYPHLHLNTLKKVHIKTGQNRVYTDHLLLNIQIPIKPRPELTPQEMETFFFDKALETLSKMPHVHISYQPLR